MAIFVTLIDSIVPLCTMLFIGYISYQVYQYYMSLMIQGKPNEWVVVINNGELKQAGIGLTLLKGPFD